MGQTVPHIECPNPSVHGNPFRYCPHCDWVEAHDDQADEAMVERVAAALAPYLTIRCAECAGSGASLRSNLDCGSCGGTGYSTRGARDTGRDAARAALAAARKEPRT